MNRSKIKVLFVCMGNICRSPTAEGVFRHHIKQANLTDKIDIDSAGTHAYHIGNSPDQRSQLAAQKRDIDISDLQARIVTEKDLAHFDYILAMDQQNFTILKSKANAEQLKKIYLFMHFASEYHEMEVPDPYYGGEQGFEKVLDMIETASQGFINFLVKQHNL